MYIGKIFQTTITGATVRDVHCVQNQIGITHFAQNTSAVFIEKFYVIRKLPRNSMRKPSFRCAIFAEISEIAFTKFNTKSRIKKTVLKTDEVKSEQKQKQPPWLRMWF